MPPTLVLSPRRITHVLLVVILFLTLASLATQYSTYFLGHDWVFGMVPKFYLGNEANVPTWYQSSTILLASALLALIAAAKRLHHDPFASHWTWLAIIFLFLSLDEAAAFHELTIQPIREALHLSGMFYWAWIIPGIAFALAVFLFYLRFLAQLPSRTRWQFLVAGALYLAGAVGIESFEGRYAELHGYENWTYSLMVQCEEFAEMFGTLIFLDSILRYLESHVGPLTLSFSDSPSKSS